MDRMMAVACVIGACAVGAAGADPGVDREALLVEGAKVQVVERMNDPDSARFRNVRVSRTDDFGEAVCGEVNGKNLFGGYAGFRPFVALRAIVIMDPDMRDSSTFLEWWYGACRPTPDAFMEQLGRRRY